MQDHQKVVQIKNTAEEDLLKRPGVTAVDVGYKYVNGQKTDTIAIRVHVAEKKDVPPDQAIPETIDGVKTDVLQNRFVLQPATMPATDLQSEVDTNFYPSLQGGISIGPCRAVNGTISAGTLGAIVFDKVSWTPMLLSNFHVLCVDSGWQVGDAIVQPSLIERGKCPTNVVGTVQRAVLGRQVDGAVARINTRGFANRIVGIGPVTGTADATLGMTVRKRGRTTGLTFGTVDGIAQTVRLDYQNGLGERILTNQISIRADATRNTTFSDHGDSGSVVVNDAGQVIGLHFAGSQDGTTGSANPIQPVLDALDVTMGTWRPPIAGSDLLPPSDRPVTFDSGDEMLNALLLYYLLQALPGY